jgi:hypothetical protein
MFAEDLKLTKSATVSTRTQRFNRSSFGVMPRRSPGERDPIGDPGLRIPTDVEVLPGTPRRPPSYKGVVAGQLAVFQGNPSPTAASRARQVLGRRTVSPRQP